MKTVTDDSEDVLRPANLLHSNVQFTRETLNTSDKMGFWVCKKVLTFSGKKTVDDIRYQQIQIPYSILEVAPLQYKTSKIAGTVH